MTDSFSVIGHIVGHFRVTEKIGAGGMGEVYRATDSRLGRDVALKIVPPALANDEQRMARFEREAQLLAALNHPHIASIYGLEVAGPTRALVMELVPGPTLADLIAQGPIPLEEALTIARQIAEALEYAHERGIIHRDLKPANIKLTPGGQVKLLDFGLAKALEDSPAVQGISSSPTLSAVASKAGIILGTAAYMSPEQAKGKPVDRRADIWAFGVMLYEMLGGKRLYGGETGQETLALVITKDPAWSELPASTPPRIRWLLERCLTKEPKQRLQAVGEARIAIEDYLAHPTQEPLESLAVAPEPIWRHVLPWGAAAVFAVASLALLALWRPWQVPLPGATAQVSAELGAGVTLSMTTGASAVLSPDGTRIVFATSSNPRLFLRSLDQLQAVPLSGTEGARDPFFSPDGQWIGFFAGDKLKKISVLGGAAVTICETGTARGGSWSDDGTIIFATSTRTGLSQVSSAGGKPQPLTSLDREDGEVTHRWPQVLPGGKAVLFTTSRTGWFHEDDDVVVQVLPTGKRKTLHQGAFYARYVPSGHLIFVHEGTLFAAPFDLRRLEVTGQAVPVLEGVVSNPVSAGALFSFSQTGTFVYLSGRTVVGATSVGWMGRDGKIQPLRQARAIYFNSAFSPDGDRLALEIRAGGRPDIWVYDWRRDTLTRLTFAGEGNVRPVWTSDGQRIIYSMQEKGQWGLWWKRADGSGDATRLTVSKSNQFAGSWRPDGKVLAYYQLNDSWDIYTLQVEGNEISGWKASEPKPFLNTSAGEVNPSFSPDGRWIAYQSNESGAYEVYVRPFSGAEGKWQISSGGGMYPQWSRTSKELIYLGPDNRIMVAAYSASGDSFQARKPAVWSETPISQPPLPFFPNFALHPDGKRVAVLWGAEGETQQQANKVTFIFNFFDELRRKVPTKP